ncbi:MAG: hypothetical protein AAGI52_10285 [Bacteroidota bacterium]
MSHAAFRFASRAALLSFGICLALTYALGWYELVFSEQVGPGVLGVLKAIPRSFTYWALWILPFWWVSVVFVSTGLTVVAVLLRAGLLWARGLRAPTTS